MRDSAFALVPRQMDFGKCFRARPCATLSALPRVYEIECVSTEAF